MAYDHNPTQPRLPEPMASEQEELARLQKADDEFVRRVLDWDVWVDTANGLLYGAEEMETRLDRFWDGLRQLDTQEFYDFDLYGDGDLPGAHALLMAYAIENLLKALIVKRGSKKLAGDLCAVQKRRRARRERKEILGRKDDLKLPRVLASHDLNQLAESAGFRPNEEESELLFRLTQSAIWSGRYGIPKTSHDNAKGFTMRSSADPGIARELFSRLKQAIDDTRVP